MNQRPGMTHFRKGCKYRNVNEQKGHLRHASKVIIIRGAYLGLIPSDGDIFYRNSKMDCPENSS